MQKPSQGIESYDLIYCLLSGFQPLGQISAKGLHSDLDDDQYLFAESTRMSTISSTAMGIGFIENIDMMNEHAHTNRYIFWWCL